MQALLDAAVDAALGIRRESPDEAAAARRRLAAAYRTETGAVDEAFARAVQMLDAAEALAFDYWRPAGDPQKLSNAEAREQLRQQCPGFGGRSYDRAMARGQADTCH